MKIEFSEVRMCLLRFLTNGWIANCCWLMIIVTAVIILTSFLKSNSEYTSFFIVNSRELNNLSYWEDFAHEGAQKKEPNLFTKIVFFLTELVFWEFFSALHLSFLQNLGATLQSQKQQKYFNSSSILSWKNFQFHTSEKNQAGTLVLKCYFAFIHSGSKKKTFFCFSHKEKQKREPFCENIPEQSRTVPNNLRKGPFELKNSSKLSKNQRERDRLKNCKKKSWKDSPYQKHINNPQRVFQAGL